jgi:peptide/nickel transport system substrate-binding protein
MRMVSPTEPGSDMRAADRSMLNRRALLRGLVAAGIVGPVLAACGGNQNASGGAGGALAQPPAPNAPPQVGPSSATSAPPTTEQQTIGKLVVRLEPYPAYNGTPADTDLVRVIRADDITIDINPTALNSYSPFTFVYDPLVWIDEYTLDPKPWLAESWQISSDGKSYTFKLRNDVKWHDGTALTAEDVAFSMITYRDDPESAVARFFPLMKNDPVVVDPYTIRFDLSDTSGDWLLNACNQFIIQKKQFSDYWNSAKGEGGKKTLKGYPYTDSMLIGTGAWKQVKYEPDAAPPDIQYQRNDSYWVGKPHFQRMIFQDVERAESQVTSWLNGDTDMLWPVTAAQIDQVKNQDGWLYNANAVAFMNAYINFQNPQQAQPNFLKDKRVRQALSTGIDRKSYAQSIFKGFVRESAIGSVAFPWAYNTNVKNPDYDLTKATQLLADAGYQKNSDGNLAGPDGQPVKLVAVVSTTNQYPVDKIAVSVQEDFRKLGVAMEIQSLEPATVQKRTRESFDYDLFFTSRVLFAGFSDYNYYHSAWDPRTNRQGRNYGGWKNETADQLLDQVIREPDLGKQKDLLWRFQEVIADDLPSLWFGFPNDLILVKKNLLGYQPNAMWQYWDTWKLWRTG